MKDIAGVIYLNRKEASKRYGMSVSWFERAGCEGSGPPYYKLNGMGKCLYKVEETDKWFKDNIVEGE